MTNLRERIFTSDKFQNAVSVLPILMGLIPKQNSQFFEVRESIIRKIKKVAIELYPSNHRGADIKMVKAQKELDELEFDKRCQLLIPFAQAEVTVELPKEEPIRLRKKVELISAEDAAFRKDMERAEAEILNTINSDLH
ncbi:hypothetical protein HZA76_04710 [Candidatus Roizmanbacteria bacterium]|nr:hypothetical protein [Candidatus Roizmanbacteria bacterium]